MELTTKYGTTFNFTRPWDLNGPTQKYEVQHGHPSPYEILLQLREIKSDSSFRAPTNLTALSHLNQQLAMNRYGLQNTLENQPLPPKEIRIQLAGQEATDALLQKAVQEVFLELLRKC